MNEFQFLQEQAYQYLRRKILADELEQDQIYSESQIARILNCSRTPVKDALTRLSHAKYVDIIPSKGFQVHKMTKEDLTSTFQTRVAVESYCALSIMEHIHSENGRTTQNRLQELLKVQAAAAQNGDVSAFWIADIDFHRTIMFFPENPDFAELYELHAYRIEEPARHSLQEPDRCWEALHEHKAIVNAIETENIRECYLTVLQHNQSTFNYGVRLLGK